MAASSSSPPPKMIKLVSSDGKEFIVEELVARVSGFIKERIEENSSNVISVDTTTAAVLKKVIK